MSFASDLKKIAARRSVDLQKIARGAYVDITGVVYIKTPVDKGEMINSWNAELNSIDDSTAVNFNITGSDSKSRLSEKLDSFELGMTFNFTNSTVQAVPIEYDGWSEKAPNGVVRVAKLRWQEIVDNQVRKYK